MNFASHLRKNTTSAVSFMTSVLPSTRSSPDARKRSALIDAPTLTGNYAYYPAEIEKVFREVSIGKEILEKTDRLSAVKGVFLWSQIDALEDIPNTDYFLGSENVVTTDCYNAVVMNNSSKQTVVVNGLDNVIVANTPDAVYIGRYGKSADVREIIHNTPELSAVAESGITFYRPWGHYEELVNTGHYRVRRVFVPSGNTIPLHSHERRTKNVMIVEGEAKIVKEGETKIYSVNMNESFPVGCEHSISNNGKDTLVFIETTIGDTGKESDFVLSKRADRFGAGYAVEPLIRLSPAFKDNLWGGTKLRDIYGMKCDYDIIAEAWMMSAHKAGQSILASGDYRGMYFGDYIKGAGKEVLGWKCSPLQNFPLLAKFIDAKDALSVQVHPNDDYALERENDYGKNEMWYVMDAEPGAGLYVGFNRDVSAEEVERRIAENTIMEVLNFFETKPGDVYYIPAGTVHAIGGGNLICEIQQSSNCTYRLYDFDRRDKFGNPRELHVKKALDVLNFNKYVPAEFEKEEDEAGTTVTRCKYFQVTVYEVEDHTEVAMDTSKFTSVICMRGEGTISFCGSSLDVKAGDSVFVPAMEGILSADGKMTLILSHV